MGNNLKTAALLGFLGALFIFVGYLLGGRAGMVTGLVLAGVMNFGVYFFSDKLALAATRAKPVAEAQAPELYSIVRALAQREGMPMPKLYLIDAPQPNAFATGRNPEHAAVAVTSGILELMDRNELGGVLAHELAHVRNRDILISTIAATLASALVFLSRMALWGGLGGSDRRRGGDPITLVIGLVSLILAPIAAMLIQMAISRSREFQADASGAQTIGSPLNLARALQKLGAYTSRVPMNVSPAVSQLFIADPLKAFRGQGMVKLFSTHPPIEERIERLQEMASGIRY